MCYRTYGTATDYLASQIGHVTTKPDISHEGLGSPSGTLTIYNQSNSIIVYLLHIAVLFKATRPQYLGIYLYSYVPRLSPGPGQLKQLLSELVSDPRKITAGYRFVSSSRLELVLP